MPPNISRLNQSPSFLQLYPTTPNLNLKVPFLPRPSKPNANFDAPPFFRRLIPTPILMLPRSSHACILYPSSPPLLCILARKVNAGFTLQLRRATPKRHVSILL